VIPEMLMMAIGHSEQVELMVMGMATDITILKPLA
jgi:hypothetical protein